MLYAEPLRRRLRVRLGGEWIADSEDVVSLHEPGRYPVAYFPIGHVDLAELRPNAYISEHPDLGMTVVRRRAARGTRRGAGRVGAHGPARGRRDPS